MQSYISDYSRKSSTLKRTYAILHLITVLLQVVLYAALKKVKLCFELLRKGEHHVLISRKVGVVAEKAQPTNTKTEKTLTL